MIPTASRSMGDQRGGPDDRTVLVLNQYALPREKGGGTRHIDLFSRTPGWRPLIVAAGRDHYSQELFKTSDGRFHLVWVPGYTGNGLTRMVGWAIYAIRALTFGLTRPHLDAVYASTPSPLSPIAGWLVARLRRLPFVLEVRDLWPETLVSAGVLRRGSALHKALTALERWMVVRADMIVVVTPGWADHFDHLRVDRSRVVVVPNGTEVSDFEQATIHTKGDVPKSNGRLRAVYAGAHGQKDGIDLILDAASELPDIDFLLVGAGNVKQAAMLRARREDISNVQFRPSVPKNELAALLAECDIGVHAVSPLPVFRLGMSPNKLFDYMAAGLPIVSNMAEGLAAIVQDGECGRLGDSHSLTDCLREVADADPLQRSEWGENARRIVASGFSRTQAAEVLARLLDEVAAGQRGSDT